MSKTRHHFLWLFALVLASGLAGCGTEIETAYGRSRGKSINGTNAVLELVRGRGHQVRAAIRYNETLANWADVIVRFAQAPGSVSSEEADWLDTWLKTKPGRKLVYIAHDSDAGPEFWPQMLATLPPTGADAERQKMEDRLRESRTWIADLPARAKQPAKVDDWFGIEPSDPKKPREVTTCRSLSGPWAAGVDPVAAALPKHEAIRAENDETVYLNGDGSKLAIGWSFYGNRDEDDSDDEIRSKAGGVLVLANGSFLVNAGLLNKARRPLAAHVLDWIGDGPSKVAFVEGENVLAESDSDSISPFHLLTVYPFNWIAAHLAGFGVLFALALATTIGRPRPEPASEIERPSAHPIALGAILARTRQTALAHEILANYRRWRHPAGATHRTDPAPTSPR